MCFVGIVSEVNYMNDLNARYSARNAGHPVLLRCSRQIIMYGEAISETLDPAQTGGIILGENSVSLLVTI